MAVGRQLNVIGQMRVDVPHLRLIESGVVYDFDTLAGSILAGQAPQVVTGFSVASWTPGADATTLQIVTAGGIVLHYGASENGTMLQVPDDRATETLSVTNSRVRGGFTASQTNYIGIDFLRSADSNTSDVVQFIDATTLLETPKTVPLGRTLDYIIVISTTPFSATTNIAPIAKVTTDANNKLVTVVDARNLYFRLGEGGDSPTPLGTYSWPEGRGVGITPANENNYFIGGDKAIGNEKDWKSAIMTRLWELAGGEYWYSDAADRNIQFYRTTPGTLADNFVATAAPPNINVKWEGLGFLFTNSTAVYNTIDDDVAVGINLLDQECLYVDVDRYTDGAALTMTKGSLADINATAPLYPGIRWVVAWRNGSDIITRNNPFVVGATVVPQASTTVTGTLRIYTNDLVGGIPYAVVADSSGIAHCLGLARSAAGSLSIGASANDTTVAIGGSSTATMNIGTSMPGAGNLTIGNTSNTNTLLQGENVEIKGGRAAGAITADVYIDTTATRTDGKILEIQNGNVETASLNFRGHWNPAAMNKWALTQWSKSTDVYVFDETGANPTALSNWGTVYDICERNHGVTDAPASLQMPLGGVCLGKSTGNAVLLITFDWDRWLWVNDGNYSHTNCTELHAAMNNSVITLVGRNSGGANYAWKSTDYGATWSASTEAAQIGTSSNICWDGTKFIYFGSTAAPNTTAYVCTDGTSWASSGVINDADITGPLKIKTNGSVVVASFLTTSLAMSLYYSSDNGANWTACTMPSNCGALYQFDWDGTRFIGIARRNPASGTIHRIVQSTDGITWTGTDVTFDDLGSATDVRAVSNGSYLLTDMGSTGLENPYRFPSVGIADVKQPNIIQEFRVSGVTGFSGLGFTYLLALKNGAIVKAHGGIGTGGTAGIYRTQVPFNVDFTTS